MFSPNAARANNLIISNANLINQDTENGTIEVQFDITWSNSWIDLARSIDAVWVVLKWETSGVYYHGTLRGEGMNPHGKNDRSDCQLDVLVPHDRKGAFIQNSDSVQGTCTDITLVWNYREDGVSDANARASTTSVVVLGLEMVYIPTASFTAGNGTSATAGFEQGDGSTNANPTVSSEGFIRFRSGSGSTEWYYNSGSNTGEESSGATFDLPGGFPKGYKGFYMMKTEASATAYRTGFYDYLSASEKANRTSITASYKAAGGVSWFDLCAFCDWYALRPMTELEFERSARGGTGVVTNEYAWGNTTIAACTALTSGGTSSEYCTNTSQNANYNSGLGAASRVGMFAKSGTSRQQAGAGFHGNLDLSGNVWEMVVSVGNVTGRNFGGTHGDGVLTTTASYQGNATNSDWPGYDTLNPTRGVSSANTLYGTGLRGGSYSSGATQLEMADRQYGYNQGIGTPNATYGIRCVRTSPEVMDSLWEDIKS